MKAAFTYTAIGILVVVVLIQIYYMNESYQDASGNVMDGSGNMVTLSLSDLFNAMRFNGAVGMGNPATSAAASAAAAAQAKAQAQAKAPLTTSTQAPTSGTWTGSGTWSGPSGASGSTSATGNMSQLIVDRSTTQPPLPIPGACDAGSGGGSCSCSGGGGGSCSGGNDGGCSGYDNMSGGGAPFNMNEYIRKDSIPCYGCTLPQ
jgi:hypothetical protein